MAIEGTKLSELKNKVEDIKGTERIYVTDGSGVPKYCLLYTSDAADEL